MGEDPVLTDPDANHVKKSLENLDLLIVQDLFITGTGKLADVILPSSCFIEKNGTFTNTERRVQRVRKAVDAPGEAKPDWQILCDVANKLGASGFDFKSAEEVFEEIRETTPSYKGISYARIEKDGIQWPCPSEDHPGTKFLHEGKFPKGKGKITPVDYREPAELPDEEYPILLSTGRMLYHYNITTRYSQTVDSIRPYELAEINPVDAEKLGVCEEGFIRVTSRRGSVVTRVTITDKVKPGMIFMTFHYRETPTNELTNSAFDPITGTGEYKVAAVKLEKIDEEEALKVLAG